MKLYDFSIERGNYFSIDLIEQNKETLALFIYHRSPGHYHFDVSVLNIWILIPIIKLILVGLVLFLI